MKKTVLILLILLILVTLSACGPETDTTTDPLSGYNVDVGLPFATQTAGVNALATPRTSQVVGWMGDIITLTEDEYADLSLGSIGTKVRNLQKRLIELGYMNGTATGTFDQATALAVRLFEQAYGRQQTGTATQVMQYYLYSETVKKYNKTLATATPTAKASTQLRTLQRGDTGDDVLNLQSRLYELGYLQKVSGSYYDAATENAVKDFESAYGRSRTGIATIQLQQYLYAGNAKSAWEVKTYTPTPTPRPTSRYSTLSRGSKGDAVTELQERLRELGYLKSKADGVYGDKTVEAVMAFEKAYGKSQTGIATASLQEFLFSAEAESAGSVIVTATPRATQSLYTTLSRGSTGDAVYMLQQRLYALGYLSGEIDGVYGGATERAVQLFESYHGATVTGVATPSMQQFLFSDSAMVYAGEEEEDDLSDDGWSWEPEETYYQLQKGDKGDDVKRLQQRLVDLGYLSGTVDGNFGDGTAQAVKAFEKAYGRSQTGIATVELQKALFSGSAKQNTSGNVAVSYSTLKSGDRGQTVSNLQQQLYQLGYYDGDITGEYDKATVQAVKDYQTAHSLTASGTASSSLQKQIFADTTYNPYAPDDTPSGGGTGGDAVTVNKKAYVSVSSTTVYSSLTGPANMATVKIGTELTVLRTRGIWAEVKNQAGAVGYCLLADLTYIDTAPTKAAEKTVTVNKQAQVNVDKLIVFESASDTSKKLGTLSRGAVVTWLRTRGEWAEIKNSAGKVGYVKANQLKLYEGAQQWDEPGLVSNPYRDLATGATGEDVKEIQSRLKELGYFYGDIGGNYKSLTTDAVKLFQMAIGLTQDGKATAGLQDIMFCEYAPVKYQYKTPSAASYKDLSYNSTGTAVSNLQKKLVSLGYLGSSAYTSGVYDEATASAVLTLQKRMGLKQQDGLATRELQAVLFTNIANKLSIK